MKVVVAIDSFKVSLSSIEAGNIIKEAITSVCDDEVVVYPLADGGEGTIEALVSGMGGEIVCVETTGPFGNQITSTYGPEIARRNIRMTVSQIFRLIHL